MYKKIIVLLAIIAPVYLYGAEQEKKRKASVASQSHKGCTPLIKEEEAKRYKAIAQSPLFYDLAVKILSKKEAYAEASRARDPGLKEEVVQIQVHEQISAQIKEAFLGLYKNHYHDWLTHRRQMKKMANAATQYAQQKHANSQCCTIL